MQRVRTAPPFHQLVREITSHQENGKKQSCGSVKKAENTCRNCKMHCEEYLCKMRQHKMEVLEALTGCIILSST